MKLLIKIAILFLVLCTFADSISSSFTVFQITRNISEDDYQEEEKEEKEEKTEKEKSEEERGEEEEFFKSKNTPGYNSLDISMHFYNLGMLLEPHNPVKIPVHPSNKKDTPPPKFIG